MGSNVSGVGSYDLGYKKTDELKTQFQKDEAVSIIEEVENGAKDSRETYDDLYNNYQDIEILNAAVPEVTTPPEIPQSQTVDEVQEIKEIYNLSATEFCHALRGDIKIELINYLESEVNAIQDSLDDTRRHNGLISGAWDGIKNFFNFGASSNKAQNEVDALKTAIETVKNDPDKLAEVYKNITGKDLNAAEYEKICTGESSLTTSTKAAQSVSKYQDGQRMSSDVFADVMVGFASAAAIAAAPFTGGASLAIGAAVGAAVKPAIKFTDAKTGGREYNLKDAGYDAVTGAVGGAMSFVGASIGNVVSTGIGKAAGAPMLEKVISTKIGGAAFNFATKSATRYATGFASGAADAAARDIMTGETDNILGDALKQGHAAGTTSIILGAAGDAVHAGINKIKGTKTPPVGTNAGAADTEILKGDILDADGNVISKNGAEVSIATVDTPEIEPVKLIDASDTTKTVDAPEIKADVTTSADDLTANQAKPQATEVKPAADAPEVKAATKPVQNTIGTKEASSINGKKLSLTDKNGNTIECTTQIKTTTNGERIEILNPEGKVIGYSNIQVMEANDFSPVYDGEAHLHVDLMENTAQSSVSGIGTELHKLNIIRSQELGLEGKVAFDSMQRAMGFHYKSGFRCATGTGAKSAEACDALIEGALNSTSGRLETIKGLRSSLPMYIPEENIQKILLS